MAVFASIARIPRTRLGVALVAVSSLCAVLFLWSSKRTSARDDADTSEVVPADSRAHADDRDFFRAHVGSLYDPTMIPLQLPLPLFEEIDLSGDLDFALFSPRHGESTSLLAQLDLQDQLFGLGQHTPFPYAGDAQYFRTPHGGSSSNGGSGGMSGGFAGGPGGVAPSREQPEQPPQNSGTAQNAIVATSHEEDASDVGSGNSGNEENGVYSTSNGSDGGPLVDGHEDIGQTGQTGSNNESGPNDGTPVKVPEPSVLVLTSIGVAMFAAARRRRTRSIEQ